MASHDIDVLLRAARRGAQVEIPEGWGQGRATFGGVVGGALVARGLGETGDGPLVLRSVTTSFLAPVAPGPATLRCEVLRRGSSAAHVEVRLHQADESGEASLRASALLVLGADRPCSVETAPPTAADRPGFDAVPTLSLGDGPVPGFLDHVDLRLVDGAHPFSGAGAGSTTGWMRFRRRPEDFGLAHLVTLVDAWPPTAAQLFARPTPLSTMTWTLELVGTPAADPGAPWWYEAVTDCVRDGYAHTHARVYDEAGQPVAVSRQTVAFFG